jgi:uncharacterized protein DUF4129
VCSLRSSAAAFRGAILAAVMTTALVAPAAARQTTGAGAPDAIAITRALDALRSDPNLAGETKLWTLRWQPNERKQSTGAPWWLWITRLVAWMGQSARYLVWVALALLGLLMVVYLGRLVRRYRATVTEPIFEAPTHIRELDIRPESLPADVGDAARQLWDRGHERDALALLYRGLLSRLAHVHRVPVRESSTEGDCLALAGDHAAPTARAYASRLIPMWQRFVYGGFAANASAVHALCGEFGPALDRPELSAGDGGRA